MLVRIFLETFALAIVFAAAGGYVVRRWMPLPGDGVAAWRWASGYFAGVGLFLALFVPLSRLTGARAAMAIALCVLAVAGIAHARTLGRSERRAALATAAAMLLLDALYTLTNAALWLMPGIPPGADPNVLFHLGSVHSGRYTNYAIYIADFDRVPFLAQNGGQSMLASLHLMLGADAPLAAMAAWVPMMLAALTVLLFGFFRVHGRPAATSAVAAYLVMFCNVAVSVVHVLVFDMGSPLAFLGYTDMALALGTFLVACAWAQQAAGVVGSRARLVAIPALFAMTWAWYAPQNLVIAAGTAAVCVLLARQGAPWRERMRRIALPAAAFVAGTLIGALQFGALLPKPMREETGFWVQDVAAEFAVRPYTAYLRSHWTGFHWNIDVGRGTLETGVYERTLAHARGIGRDEIYRDVAWLVEETAWESIRVYGFPLLGLALLAWRLRRSPGAEAAAERAWLVTAAGALATGFAICFLLELGHIKWWLTRFLMPGSMLAIMCLALCYPPAAVRAPRRVRALAAALVFVATVGPLLELAAVAWRQLVLANEHDPVAQRLRILATAPGPFLFESLVLDGAADRLPDGSIVIGAAGRSGLAIHGPAMRLLAGDHRWSLRAEPAIGGPRDRPLLILEVSRSSGGPVLARRELTEAMLVTRDGGHWADVAFDTAEAIADAQLKVYATGNAPVHVTAARFSRP